MDNTVYKALYLHIPFCRAKCAYCDFDSRAPRACDLDAALDVYFESLMAQVRAHGDAGELSVVQTVYIGGGTPTVAGSRLVNLVELVRSYCDPHEFTCEANPESFTEPLARSLRAAGVTRVSLGVQSLCDAELRAIGRIHNARGALDAIARAKSCGFSTSCDLMCGLPEQTAESWRSTLAGVIDAAPDHVSVYPLQLEEGTPLELRVEAGGLQIPDEDFQAECMEEAAVMLEQAGYARYEVASYAKPGHACQHNIAYWAGEPYLGLGRSAASMRNLVGTDNQVGVAPAMRSVYGRERIKQLDDEGTRFEREELTAREAAAEDLMLACRMMAGIPCELFERVATCIPRHKLDAACAKAVSLGLVAWDNGSLRPTHAGWLEGNELYGIFWDLAKD